MAVKKFKKYLPLLKLLSKKCMSQKCFISLINSLDKHSIKFICECIHNAISVRYVSRLSVKKKDFLKKILPYKKIIGNLCKKGKSFGSHRNLIAQKGYGFIFPILSAVIPLVLSLLNG